MLWLYYIGLVFEVVVLVVLVFGGCIVVGCMILLDYMVIVVIV